MKKQFFISKFIMFISLTLIPICIFGSVSVFFINLKVKQEAEAKNHGHHRFNGTVLQ